MRVESVRLERVRVLERMERMKVEEDSFYTVK